MSKMMIFIKKTSSYYPVGVDGAHGGQFCLNEVAIPGNDRAVEWVVGFISDLDTDHGVSSKW